ncbi:MAG: dehydrogenase [Deltaproteobacteria bacterium]|nr:dehydrogenase [Deltaproteobacteria bacterium]
MELVGTSQLRSPRKGLSAQKLIELYTGMLRPRMIEEKMLLLLRQGKVSKWFSGIGQEAIAVGSTMALERDEYILPLHRNLGVFTSREIPLERLLAQWQGTLGGFTKGRDRSFHFGTNEFHIVGMISHLGPQMGVADGIALSELLKKSGKLALVYSGEGGTSEGDFHESINVAAVWNLPVIFLVENNGYALSTPTSEQFRCKRIADKAAGFGIEGLTIDGNNIVDVYETVSALAASIRKNPRPVLLECMTFRMRGHEEASGTKYVPKELFAEWEKKDPLNTFEKRLLADKILSPDRVRQERERIAADIERAVDVAFAEAPVEASAQQELEDVYRPHTQKVVAPQSDRVSKRRFVDAIGDALKLAMQRHSNLVLMGQDIAEYGGVFKVTEGLVEQFGRERVRNTPLCESAIVGTGLGLSIGGFKSVVEMQFADFVTCGFNQIVNNLAKVHYRWGQNADVVVRMPTGAGTGAGPFHSQSNEAWFIKTPGLKVIYPAFPSDAKGLLLAAIEDPNPVMFFEHKLLYRSVQEDISDDYYTVEIGKGRFVARGEQASIITYGSGVHWALEFLKAHPEYSLDVLDLRTLQPFDREAIRETVAKTNRVLILHEDTLCAGLGAELAAFISQDLFTHLDAPVMRCASLETPIPFCAALEKNFLAKAYLEENLKKLLAF